MTLTAEEIRKRTMGSNIFGDDTPQNSYANQNPQSPSKQNANYEMQSHIFDSPAPQERHQESFQRVSYEAVQPHPEYYSQRQTPQQNYSPMTPPTSGQAQLPRPHHASFLDTSVKPIPLPTFDQLVVQDQVPALSPFPEFSFETPQMNTQFSFNVRPPTTASKTNSKGLNYSVGSEMQSMRAELQRDAQEFQGRISQIHHVDLVQPVRPVTAEDQTPRFNHRQILQ